MGYVLPEDVLFTTITSVSIIYDIEDLHSMGVTDPMDILKEVKPFHVQVSIIEPTHVCTYVHTILF